MSEVNPKLPKKILLIILTLISSISFPVRAELVQQEVVPFPGIGEILVRAHIIQNQFPTVEFFDLKGKRLLNVEMGHTDKTNGRFRAGIEFKALSIAGFPNPMLMIVSAAPHGSDTTWEVSLISGSSGQLRVLWRQPDVLFSEGGFYLGNLGKCSDLGIGIWDSISNEAEECHLCPHRYKLKLFPWDGKKKKFKSGSSFETKRKYKDGGEALKELGFQFPNQILQFKRLEEFR